MAVGFLHRIRFFRAFGPGQIPIIFIESGNFRQPKMAQGHGCAVRNGFLLSLVVLAFGVCFCRAQDEFEVLPALRVGPATMESADELPQLVVHTENEVPQKPLPTAALAGRLQDPGQSAKKGRFLDKVLRFFGARD
jgi:hypothetical protein